MSIRRFMINSASVSGDFAMLDGDTCNHMVRVLRMVSGDSVQLTDENGIIRCGVIEQVTRERVTVRILSVQADSAGTASAPRITICQALPKGDKIDLILQKGTELGAHDFRIFGGCRSVARIRDDQLAGKLDRWNRITSEAARQCGRSDIPAVSWRNGAREAADDSGEELRLILWEGEREYSLKEALASLSKPVAVAVAIGPEGGFDPQELRHFTRNGFQPVSLGSRILRTETASIAILAIMQYVWGEL